ncbi:hypothetical protein [Nocardioides sambongensis]|uniref:hypothetical protein n=1 Tax=Nocardioides sambongensis TaxID=2589074 RepID=UPI00112B985A|nr:hypothetical protein [Nocardioides sambongensis]
MSTTGGGTDPAADAAEVQRLREEVARLKAQVAEPAAADPVADEATPGGRRTGWWRPVVATVLIVVMALLSVVSVVARWAHDEVSDTDRYVETVAPLAEDPVVQAAAIDRITNEIVTRLEIEAVTQQGIDALTERGLPPLAATSLQALADPLAGAVESFIRQQVTRLVESETFAQAWEQANRQAHTQLVAVLTGKDGDSVEVTDNAVRVNLATVIEAVQMALVERGFTLAERLPTINAEFTIFASADLARAQSGFRILSALSVWLPIVALLCLAGAVAVGRSRRRTFVAGALALGLAMLLLGVALNVFREIYANAIPADQIRTDVAVIVYDALVEFIRVNLRAVLVIALAAAFIAWVSGPERTPTALRRGTGTALAAVRGGGERVGVNTGRFGVALHEYQVPLRIGVLAAALVIYVMRDHPSGAFALWLVAITAVVLLLVAVLARPAPVTVGAPEPEPAGGPGAGTPDA